MRLAVSGKVLKQALEHALTGDGPDAHVAGIVVWYDSGKPAGRRLKKARLANGKDVDDGRTYTLAVRSEEHTSELQSRLHLVCRLLLEKKKKKQQKQTLEGYRRKKSSIKTRAHNK